MKKASPIARIAFLLVFLLSACSPAPIPTATLAPTQPTVPATAEPTLAPTSTSTAQPTSTGTPLPSPTPTPTLEPTPMGGSFPKIAHFFMPLNASDPASQGVYLMDFGSKNIAAQILSVPDSDVWYPLLKFSPDGKSVLVAPNYSNDVPASKTKTLDIIDVKSGSVQHLRPIAENIYIEEINWSPDGKWALMRYYYFRSTVHCIDLVNTTSGTTASISPALFEEWLPDSSGFIYHKSQSEIMFLYDVKHGQNTPYLTIPHGMIFDKTKANWRFLKVLPQLDAILMDSGGKLTLIPHLSQLLAPTYWDITAVLESAVSLGKIPDSIYYANTSFIPSLGKDKIMISGPTDKGETFTLIFSVDGTTPPVIFTGIQGLAWAPDDQSFLGIRLKQVPYLGSFSSSSPAVQPGYFIQPISAGTAVTSLYEIPPTCGLLSKAKSTNRTFQQRRIMSNCINSMNTQDAFWQ